MRALASLIAVLLFGGGNNAPPPVPVTDRIICGRIIYDISQDGQSSKFDLPRFERELTSRFYKEFGDKVLPKTEQTEHSSGDVYLVVDWLDGQTKLTMTGDGATRGQRVRARTFSNSTEGALALDIINFVYPYCGVKIQYDHAQILADIKGLGMEVGGLSDSLKMTAASHEEATEVIKKQITELSNSIKHLEEQLLGIALADSEARKVDSLPDEPPAAAVPVPQNARLKRPLLTVGQAAGIGVGWGVSIGLIVAGGVMLGIDGQCKSDITLDPVANPTCTIRRTRVEGTWLLTLGAAGMLSTNIGVFAILVVPGNKKRDGGASAAKGSVTVGLTLKF